MLMGKRELIALLNLSSWCLVMVERLFLTVPLCCLQFVIVVFPDHTHLLFWMKTLCVPCFVFGPVVFCCSLGHGTSCISSSTSIIPRNGNWFLYLNCILLLCVHVFV